MENKKKNETELDVVIPDAGADDSFDEDIVIPEEPSDEKNDDELDIPSLLQRYLPDFATDGDGAGEDEAADTEEADDAVSDEDAEASHDAADDSYAEEVYADPDEYTADELAEDDYDDYSAEEYYANDALTDEVVYADDETEYTEVEQIGEVYEEDTAESVDGEESSAEAEDYSEYEYVSDDAAYQGNDAAIGNEEELVVPEDTGLDATDINLMVAFGLDDELAATMGADVAAKLTEEIDAEARQREEKNRRSVENEFLDPSQIPEIAADLKKRHSRLKAKMLFAGMLSLLLLVYENLELLGIQFGSFLNPAVYPVIYVMVSLQIMLFVAAIGYEQLLTGCGELFTGKVSPSSVAFVSNVGAIVYSVIQAETAVIPVEPVLFNSCAAFMTLFALVSDYLSVKQTMLSFNIVSAKRPKYVVRYMTASEAGIPGGLFEDDDVSEGGILRIEKTKFVDDFFARTTDRTKNSKSYSAAYLFISVILAVIMGVFVAFKGGDSGIGAVGAAFTTFFAAMPLSLFLSMSYPMYASVSDAYDLDGTIVGESAAEEYAEAGAVCFDDIDAFPSYGVKVQNIKIYNNHRIDRVLYYAASAFKVAGGPLADVFEVATMEIGTSDDVELTAADEGYLGAKVDGKNIIFGRADKLREYGINLPDSVILEDETLSQELCPMYMLREGKIMAKLILRYMIDSDFEFLMKDLSDEGMCACIKTFDPNIDDSLVTMRLGGGRFPFRVLRYNSTEEINRISERMSSGIVSRGTTKPLLNIIGACSKMLSARRSGFVVGVVSAIIAALIVGILVISGGVSTLTSFAVVMYQLLWSIPVFIIAKMFLR